MQDCCLFHDVQQMLTLYSGWIQWLLELLSKDYLHFAKLTNNEVQLWTETEWDTQTELHILIILAIKL